ncbi:MAG: hypothetical protein O2905_01720 [Proteobacteria bacterium]|nr:hypothetical protein [Pseudomonadota bacterium]MDA1131928.1 hypothetical protein [Pseudomonadota bacterium]
MPVPVETFRHEGNRHTGTTLFKALGHPKSARLARDLVSELRGGGPIAVVDPDGAAEVFDAFYGLADCDIAGVYVQNVEDVGRRILGHAARPLSEIADTKATPFLARFDSRRLQQQLAAVTGDAAMRGFDDIRLPGAWLGNARNYLDPLNFATNFAFLRDQDGHHTAVRSANYWGGYGAADPELWLCLFNADGDALAEWTQPLPHANGTYQIDSREVRARFGLGPFAGSLFLHALRARGHDVVKYALDTFGDGGDVLSATHDANAWPADFYAGVPAPDDGERVVLWVQNSHPMPIPARSIGVNVMGSDDVAWLDGEIPAFATRAVDVGALAPTARWPSQLEVHAGRHFVRPRYEVIGPARTRIAHANVERTDLAADPHLPGLANRLGKGFILPMPILPPDRYRTTVLPTPMARGQHDLPLAAIAAAPDGREAARRFLGRLPRGHRSLLDVDGLVNGDLGGFGHLELVYDFADGGGADGWLHAIARYQDRETGHIAETSFGAHIFNILDVYKDEPQSYAGPPPGLTTRLFLRVGPAGTETLCHLIYAASKPWRAESDTHLILTAADGAEVATETIRIACGGSRLWRVDEVFDARARERAGENCYVLVRDTTCRLFGYHGLRTEAAFSFDHMFGF